jgi:hypothetical protein
VSKHTPGPWHLGSHGEQYNFAHVRAGSDDSAETIAEVFGLYINTGRAGQKNEEAIANARLIAAAPELLAALKACREAFVPEGGNADLWVEVDAALVRAEGTA